MSSININNYFFDKPLTCDNSGFSKWGIGQRNGKNFFVKEFLSPVFPVDTSMFTPQKRKERMTLCASFVKSKEDLYSAINEISDGNLIGVEQFFRVNAKYYISTKAITNQTLSISEIAKQPFYERLKLCCIIAHAMTCLHSKKIVHADIKPDNVLVFKKTKIQAKIIDFDCSFFEKDAPKRGEELNGDMVYLSPEAFLHIIGEYSYLSCKMDVFALGLLFHQYMTGHLPSFDTNEYQYAYEVVLDNQSLGIDQKLNSVVFSLILKMLDKEPKKRPDMETVFFTLQHLLLKILNRKITYDSPPKQEKKGEFSQSPFFVRGGNL